MLVVGIFLADSALAANRSLEKARSAYQNLDYAKTQSLLQKALKAPCTLEEEVEIYFLLGTIHVIYGRDAQAKEAFREVLARNLAFELPADTSPKIRAAFADAQSAGADQAPTAQRESEKPAVTASPAELPLAAPAALDPLALVGGDDNMMPTTSSSGRHSPFYQTWWFWTVVGVAVASGGAYLTYTLVQPGYPEHDKGPIQLR
jgi:hypothetical protein